MPAPPPFFCLRAAMPPPVLLAPPATVARRGAVPDPERSRAEGGEPVGAAAPSPAPAWSWALRLAMPPPLLARHLLNSMKTGGGGGAFESHDFAVSSAMGAGAISVSTPSASDRSLAMLADIRGSAAPRLVHRRTVARSPADAAVGRRQRRRCRPAWGGRPWRRRF